MVAGTDRVEVIADHNRARVVEPNIPACNSWVHVIDRVLLPCELVEPAGYDQRAAQALEFDLFEGDGTDTFTGAAAAPRTSATLAALIAAAVAAWLW